MHVFSRGVNEGLTIGEHLTVTVLEVGQNHVRLAISSPHCEPSYWEETLYLQESSPSLPAMPVELQIR